MITAVDTSVLIDILTGDAIHGGSSAAALRECLASGAVIACDIVWAETCAGFARAEPFLAAMKELGVTIDPLSEQAATEAGNAWGDYRRASGIRDRFVADFLVGAHARVQADRLLTRDRGFYRRFFGGLVLFQPASTEADAS